MQQLAKNQEVTDYRFFVRSIIRHSDLVTKEASFDYLRSEGERTLLEAMDALEVAFSHYTVGKHQSLNIKYEKFVVMHIGANNNLYTYNMNNAKLKTVHVERDLGVIINRNGKYSEVFTGCKKANCVLGMITRNIKCKNSDIIMKLYKSLVRPRLEYCIQAWSPYIRRILKFWKECKNGLQWFMGVRT